jgi:glycosyltransferase involved in cell wall biosynthesis
VSDSLPLISIVIPTWNRPARVEKLIGAINAGNDRGDIEIVVVDNNSAETNWIQLQLVGNLHKNVRLYRNPTNIGMTPNWNKAIEHARGEWISFMCDDDMYKSDSIDRMRAIIQSNRRPCLVLQNAGVLGESDWLEPGIDGQIGPI